MPVTIVATAPKPSFRKYDWASIAEELKSAPGQWGRVDPVEGESASVDSAQSVARNVRQGAIKSMPRGQFEATSRANTVYVRYVGTPNSEVAS